MGVLGEEIKKRITTVTFQKFQEYVDKVNQGKSPGDPGYLDLSPGDPVWPDPVNNDDIDIDHINAYGDAIEDYISERTSLYLPLFTPEWEDEDPIVEQILEIEPNNFRPVITLSWKPSPTIDPWNSETIYDLNDFVEFNGDFYRSSQELNEGNSPDEIESEWWIFLEPTEIEVRVLRKEGTGAFKYLGSTFKPDLTFIDESAKFNTFYEYRLIRFDSGAQFSDFSDVRTITTTTFPTPATPDSAPIVTPAPGSIGIEIQTVSSNANVVFYKIQFREQNAVSSNDGSFSIPTISSWGLWQDLSDIQGTRLIHNGLLASRVYQYRYAAVSNYGIQSGFSPESIQVIPFAKIDRDDTNLQYYSEIFQDNIPSGSDFRKIIYSHSSLDPQEDPSISSLLVNNTWWWKTNTGEIWSWNETAGSWSTQNQVPLLSIQSYNSLLNSTITPQDKEALLENYKTIIFRKLTLERFAAKLKNIQEDVGFISIKEKFISLIDTYFNSLYGVLINIEESSTNHSVPYLKESYKNYVETEIEFSEYLFQEYLSTLSRSFVNDNFSLSLGETT